MYQSTKCFSSPTVKKRKGNEIFHCIVKYGYMVYHLLLCKRNNSFSFLYVYVFTTTRYFYYKNRKRERGGSQVTKTLSAITSQSSTLPVAFHSGFLPISPKTEFFRAKYVSKRTPTAFLVLVTLRSSTLEILSCFTTIFATSVANTLSARARITKNTQKCQKRRFLYFCT